MNKTHKEIFIYFLRLGILGFGGPLALVSSMQKDLVEDKKWMTLEDFKTVFSLIKAMPGTVAFQVAVFLGRERGGFLGGFLSGLGLILPASLLMILFSIFLKNIESFQVFKVVMLGMQVGALGVILASLKGLVKNHYKEFFFWFLVILSGAINYKFAKLEPVVILFFGSSIVLMKKYSQSLFDLSILFLVCFKAGALVFGTGLAIVPMLSHDVVDTYHWLSKNEFLDALTFGQMTPGPVVVTATYIGHKVFGMSGALVATIAIFLAPFIHMTTWFPHAVKKLKGKEWINDFTFGAVAAVVGPIIVTVYKLSLSIPHEWGLLVIGVLSFIFSIIGLIPTWAVIPLSGVFSYFLL